MSVSLPESVAIFFHVSNGASPSSLRNAFSANAIVHDEGQTYQGHDAIEAWLAQAQRKYVYRVEPVTVVKGDAGATVVARYVGKFPGSPVDLIHVFRFADDQVVFLDIH